MTDAFYMLDKDWRFTYLNKEAERLLQRPRTDLLGKVIWKECRDLIGTTFEVEFRRAVSQNRAVSFEEVYIPFNSWKELRIFPSDKGPAAYFTEISERKRLQELQRQSEERFKVVARATTDIIWDWDTRADRIGWNEGLQIQFGYVPEDFDHGFRSWACRIHPEESARMLQKLYAAMDGLQENWCDEYRIMRKDDSYADVKDRGFFIRDPGGKVVRMIGSMVDITERKQSELERQEAEAARRSGAASLAGR